MKFYTPNSSTANEENRNFAVVNTSDLRYISDQHDFDCFKRAFVAGLSQMSTDPCDIRIDDVGWLELSYVHSDNSSGGLWKCRAVSLMTGNKAAMNEIKDSLELEDNSLMNLVDKMFNQLRPFMFIPGLDKTGKRIDALEKIALAMYNSSGQSSDS